MATWDDVRRLSLALPSTTERTSYGNVSWAVSDKQFVWERPLRRGDLEALGATAPTGDVLGVRVADLEAKEAVLVAFRTERRSVSPTMSDSSLTN